MMVLAALAGLGGCANDPYITDAVHKELVSPYHLDSGDRLRVIVFGQDDLTNTYTVDKAGTLSMPLIGPVPARGRTPGEIDADVTARLSAEYLRDPDVSVEVDSYRPFFAMGEVNAAGQYPYVAGMTVLAAIAVAGGFTTRADKVSVDVTRSIGGVVTKGELRLTDPVMPGDTLYVRERRF
jgi:polysaccharide export outer membrane protein